MWGVWLPLNGRTLAPDFIKLISRGGIRLQGGECFGVNLIVQTNRTYILLEIAGRMAMATVKEDGDPVQGGGLLSLQPAWLTFLCTNSHRSVAWSPFFSLRVGQLSVAFFHVRSRGSEEMAFIPVSGPPLRASGPLIPKSLFPCLRGSHG